MGLIKSKKSWKPNSKNKPLYLIYHKREAVFIPKEYQNEISTTMGQGSCSARVFQGALWSGIYWTPTGTPLSNATATYLVVEISLDSFSALERAACLHNKPQIAQYVNAGSTSALIATSSAGPDHSSKPLRLSNLIHAHARKSCLRLYGHFHAKIHNLLR